MLDGTKLGWVDWFLRLQATPGSADSIAEALARRPDTSWVRLASGGTEIACTLEERTPEQRDALLLRGLPGSRRVAQISAHSILHEFTPGAWQEVTRALSPAQLEMLGPPAQPPAAPAEAVLLADDEPLLAELARDGRASHAALAAAIHWHESTVRRRMDELRRAGLLHFEIDLDNRAFGLNVQAMLWLSVEPGRLDETGPRPRLPPRDPVRRRHDRADQPAGQRRLPRHAASLRVPHRRAGRPARRELGPDRADHPDPQAHRLSATSRPPCRRCLASSGGRLDGGGFDGGGFDGGGAGAAARADVEDDRDRHVARVHGERAGRARVPARPGPPTAARPAGCRRRSETVGLLPGGQRACRR